MPIKILHVYFFICNPPQIKFSKCQQSPILLKTPKSTWPHIPCSSLTPMRNTRCFSDILITTAIKIILRWQPLKQSFPSIFLPNVQKEKKLWLTRKYKHCANYVNLGNLTQPRNWYVLVCLKYSLFCEESMLGTWKLILEAETDRGFASWGQLPYHTDYFLYF